MPTQEDNSTFRVWGVASVSLGHFMHDIFPAFLAPLLPLLIEQHGLSYALAGLLVVFLRLPSLLNPFIGVWADRTDIRALVILSPAATACCMSLLPGTSSYAVLVVLLLVTGFSSSSFHVPAPVLVRRLSGYRVGTGMSVYMLGGELARSVGPMVLLAALSLWGMRGTYRLIILGVAASAFLFLRLRRYDVHRDLAPRHTTTIFRELIRHRRLYVILAGLLLSRNVVTAALTTFLPTFLTNRGSSLWLAGGSLSILELAAAAGVFGSGSLSDRIGRRKILLATSVVTPILMGAFLLVGGWGVFPLLVLLGVFVFSSSPVLLAVVQESVSAYPSTANGVFMTIGFLAFSLCAFGIGIMGDHIGLEATYWICAGLSVFGIPLSLALPISRRPAARAAR